MDEIAYKPVGQINPSNANYKIITQVPNYDDVGVSYKGYSKTQVSSTNYQLNKQTPRRISWCLTNLAAGTHLADRPNWKSTKLYVTGIQLHWKLASGIFKSQFHIADVDEFGSANPRFYEYFFQIGEQNFFINLKDHPILFSGKFFDIYTQMSLGASDYVHVEIFGWEE